MWPIRSMSSSTPMTVPSRSTGMWRTPRCVISSWARNRNASWSMVTAGNEATCSIGASNGSARTRAALARSASVTMPSASSARRTSRLVAFSPCIRSAAACIGMAAGTTTGGCRKASPTFAIIKGAIPRVASLAARAARRSPSRCANQASKAGLAWQRSSSSGRGSSCAMVSWRTSAVAVAGAASAPAPTRSPAPWTVITSSPARSLTSPFTIR